MAVISFHSIEDRAIKQFFREKEDLGMAARVNKKPILPTEEEISENPRSRSAKLRIVEKK
jgi:16S rRNA (cytosine1402-N4)-methyltransferase